MFRVVLVSVTLILVAADSEEMRKKCSALLHPDAMFCCTKRPPKPEKMDFSDCADLSMQPTTCEREICLGKKKGLLAADGSINKKATSELIEKQFENIPDLVEAIKDKCVDGDLDAYGPKEFCDMIKMKNCMQIQFMMQCPEFSDEGECSQTKALVKECSAAFS